MGFGASEGGGRPDLALLLFFSRGTFQGGATNVLKVLQVIIIGGNRDLSNIDITLEVIIMGGDSLVYGITFGRYIII